MAVLDFDGVMVKSRRGEKLWRWLAEKMKIKTPKIFFFLQEIIEFIFDVKPRPIKKTTEAIKRYKRAKYRLGILTDRSLFSLCRFFNANNNGIRLDDFDFIQIRNSRLNRLALDHLIKPPLFIKNEKQMMVFSKKTKLDFQTTFLNLKMFAAKNNIETQEILIIDDLPQILKAAKINGFSISPPFNLL